MVDFAARNPVAALVDPKHRARGAWCYVDRVVPEWHRAWMGQVLEEERRRITARVPDHVRATLEQAAGLLGANVNQFIVQAAYQEAQRIIEREAFVRVKQKDAGKLLALLDKPPKPNRKLKAAVQAAKGTLRV
jgi:uncharacterized protein (DUF1778 family)